MVSYSPAGSLGLVLMVDGRRGGERKGGREEEREREGERDHFCHKAKPKSERKGFPSHRKEPGYRETSNLEPTV